MKKTRILALTLCFLTIVSMFSQDIAFAKNYDDAEKGKRQVYLHAFDETPTLNTSEIRNTVYMGENTNIYLAVDDPNKGDYLTLDHPDVEAAQKTAYEKATAEAENNPNFTTEEQKLNYIETEVAKAVELARHSEPQYDMQGYTVKIYFDTKYFKFADSENPLDFKEPNNKNGFEIVDGEEIKTDPALNPGYMTHKPSYKCIDTDREGYAAATIFLMGNGFFPNKVNPDLWYNLCKLSLTPIQTGNTSVRIEYNMGTADDLELYAKNVDDEKLNFDASVKNDGVFYLTIEEAGRPTRPIATKPGGTYNDTVDVQLYHTNNDTCEIYYSTNGEDPRNTEKEGVYKYTQNVDVSKSDILSFKTNTELKARTYRPQDGKWSDLATYTYEFLPRAPYLFNSEEKEIPNIYSETWQGIGTGYYVYTADNKDFSQGISAGNSIYYTFKEDLSPDYIALENSIYVSNSPDGNPETQWVIVNAASQQLGSIIDKTRTARLVTSNKWGISEVSVYHLGIKPANVTAAPTSGLDVEQPIKLECATQGAKIYYTTNGDDPRKEPRFEYTEPLYLDEDTVIKAVSLYDGKWSDVTSFWYIFSNKNKSGVSAVYPSGVYTGSVEVILYPDEPGQGIEVSFDGGRTWQDYDGTIVGDTTTIDKHIEFNARIKSPENTDEDLGDKFVYIIKPLAPVFSPESCDFTSADVVTVFSPESTNENKDRFELWYSLDGTEPNGSLKAPDNDVLNLPITGYTKIKAVVVKDGEYMSEVVEHTYNVVYDKPAKPQATLPSGYYTKETGSDEFTTEFLTPPNGVEIYYTIGDKNTPFDAPDLTTEGGAIKYENGTKITVTNNTMIKAVSIQIVNGNIRKSDVSVFDYTITPESPTAPDSAVVKELPLIPVDAVTAEKTAESERCFVEYKIGNDTQGYETVKFCVDETNSDGHIRFFIDTKTGNAYKTADKSEILHTTQKSENFSGNVILEIKSILDDQSSETNAYAYIIGDVDTPLTAPFADKKSGTYIESKTNFSVKLFSVYEDRSDIKIMWKYDGDASWTEYDPENPPEFETKDKIIYAKTVDESGNESPSVGYIYTFNPPVPNITPASGIYLKTAEEKSYITQSNDIAVENIGNYNVYYKLATDDGWSDVRGNNTIDYLIDKTMTVIAYTYNRQTGRVSDTVSRSYVVVGESSLSAITIKYPFSKSRISAHELGKGIYASGIQFIPESDVYYEYAYTLTDDAGGGTYKSDTILYDEKAAFVPTERIDYMTVTAWINGDKNNTQITHAIDFVHLDVPVTDLPEQTEYTKNTVYHIVNSYLNDPTIIVYYTTDNSDPTLEGSSRKSFTGVNLGAEEKLTQTTTVKAVYFSACGESGCVACNQDNYKNCPDGIYAKIGEYKYPVPTTTTVTVGGGGSGSVTIDKTRKYTKDIFGNEHPTHIGYINGYPDGSVKPEGDISREEITAILYRITSHEYEKPFIATGDAFTDVNSGRWSAHDIEYMADKGVVLGYPDGEFKPAKSLSRAEFAALIFRFTNLKKVVEKNPFTDLDDTHWAYDEISALSSSGLVEGYEDSTFKPENNITRAEVMTVINKLLGRKPLESYVKSLKFNPYNDLYENKWYYVAVLEATITHNYWLNDADFEYKWEDCK